MWRAAAGAVAILAVIIAAGVVCWVLADDQRSAGQSSCWPPAVDPRGTGRGPLPQFPRPCVAHQLSDHTAAARQPLGSHTQGRPGLDKSDRWPRHLTLSITVRDSPRQ